MCYRRVRVGRARQTGSSERRRAAGLCVVLAAAAVAAAGCSASGGARLSDLPMAAVAAQLPDRSVAVDPAQLRTALLAKADMGSDFSALPTPAGSAGSVTGSVTGMTAGSTAGSTVGPMTAGSTAGAVGITGCPQLGVLTDVGRTVASDDQGVTYRALGGMPVVGESLRAGATASVAAEYAEDRAALATCAGVNVAADGTEFTLQLTPVTLSVKSATAVRLDGMLGGVQVVGYLALDDLGPAELGYVFLQVGNGSPQLATYYFGKADDKARHYLDAVWSS